MPNRLIDETSPYLLQHAHNPVDWYPWGEEALDKARREQKPIFLSIGYAACHWCHVMEHESFEDAETARLMNENFVSIKVDREERPDLDSIYMDAVTALTGSGGWPMSLFLTPEGRPFYGGTYYPNTPRYGVPAFKEVLAAIAHTWKEKRDEVDRVADQLTGHLQEAAQWSPNANGGVQAETLQQAAAGLLRQYDWDNGGWGGAPKFPQPMAIEFLLRQAARGDAAALKAAAHALHAMNRGGMYDVVGGGFHRYSTDEEWLVPHFEKMLYDNGQLALVYLHTYLLTGDLSFRRTCTQTLDFILREMTGPSGGFYSSLDADSEGEEGKFYLWTMEEINEVLADAEEFDLFRRAYGLRPQGNFEGKTVLQREKDDTELARDLDLSLDWLHQRLDRAHAQLVEARRQRIRPATDDKVLVAWNALALQALAEAARCLRREDYLEAARRNADFLLTHLYQDGRLLRAWRQGQAHHAAFLEDYAGLALALLALYQSDPDPRWYQAAVKLAEEMLGEFRDEAGGFYTTRGDQPDLVVRPKELQDNAVPSGNALAAMALLQLSAYSERGDWRDTAERLLSGLQEVAVQYPTAFSFWLQGMDFAAGPVRQVALLYPQPGPEVERMVDYLWQTYRPRTLAAISAYPPAEGSPDLLHDRPLRDDAPTVYVCEDFTCDLPVNTLEDLEDQLPASTRPS